jgi:hypothetical protein
LKRFVFFFLIKAHVEMICAQGDGSGFISELGQAGSESGDLVSAAAHYEQQEQQQEQQRKQRRRLTATAGAGGAWREQQLT